MTPYEVDDEPRMPPPTRVTGTPAVAQHSATRMGMHSNGTAGSRQGQAQQEPT